MALPIDLDALIEMARQLMPPQFMVLVRPEDAEDIREAVKGSAYAELIEVQESPEIPEGQCIMLRKELVEASLKDLGS